MRRDEGEGAGRERGAPARERREWKRKKSRREKLVARDVQEAARGVKRPEQQRNRQRRVQSSRGVSQFEWSEVVLQEREGAVDAVERRAQGRAGSKEGDEERRER